MYFILKSIIYLVHPFIRNDKLLIIETHYPSGSNTKAMSNGLKTNNIEHDVIVYPNYVFGENKLMYKIRLFKFHIYVSKYRVVLNTDGYKKIYKKQILVDYWHGIPIKSMLYMLESTKEVNVKHLPNPDYLITGSKIESTLLNSCMYIPFGKHKVLGNPRIDFLYDSISVLDYLNEDISYIEKISKVGILMPTFRQSLGHGVDGVIYNNLFNMKNFNEAEFEKFLEKNGILLIVKMHPLDMKDIKLIKNTATLDIDKIRRAGLDLYQLLSTTDFLISDYSSIIYDYTVLEKPIVMLSSDIDSYKGNRGFLYSPINKLINVGLSTDQLELEKRLIEIVNNKYILGYNKNEIHEFTFDNVNRNIKWLEEIMKKDRR